MGYPIAKLCLTSKQNITNIADMTKQNDFPAILRATRAALNLTQEQLAERLGVSFATVNRWEGGGNKPQRAAQETILALAREAGVEGAESPPPAEAAAQVTRRRTRRGGGRAGVAPTTKPMEQMLWDAACSIRGEKDAAKFKDYLLPLLFLKRLSDVFDDEIERLAEEYGDRATRCANWRRRATISSTRPSTCSRACRSCRANSDADRARSTTR